jgi:hypothetical protein
MDDIDTDYELEEVLNKYRLDGSMNRLKSRVLHEQALEKLYVRLISETTPTNQLIDIARHLAEVGDLRPKTNAQPQSQGPAFSISIVIPQQDGKEPIVIDAKAVEPVDAEEAEEEYIGQIEQSCDGVMPIAVPDFDLSSLDELDDLVEEDEYDG